MPRRAKKPGKIGENPWDDIQKRREVSHSRRELTVEETPGRPLAMSAP